MGGLEECTATEPIAVDGATGLIGGAGCDLAVVTTDGRGYWISLRKSDGNPAAVAPYDRAWFEEVLATVQLHPEDADRLIPTGARAASTAARSLALIGIEQPEFEHFGSPDRSYLSRSLGSMASARKVGP